MPVFDDKVFIEQFIKEMTRTAMNKLARKVVRMAIFAGIMYCLAWACIPFVSYMFDDLQGGLLPTVLMLYGFIQVAEAMGKSDTEYKWMDAIFGAFFFIASAVIHTEQLIQEEVSGYTLKSVYPVIPIFIMGAAFSLKNRAHFLCREIENIKKSADNIEYSVTGDSENGYEIMISSDTKQ